MKRYHQEIKISKSRAKLAKEAGFGFDGKLTDLALGRFRKQHPFDCGNPECGVCHKEKFNKVKTHKQKIADMNFKEQL